MTILQDMTDDELVNEALRGDEINNKFRKHVIKSLARIEKKLEGIDNGKHNME